MQLGVSKNRDLLQMTDSGCRARGFSLHITLMAYCLEVWCKARSANLEPLSRLNKMFGVEERGGLSEPIG